MKVSSHKATIAKSLVAGVIIGSLGLFCVTSGYAEYQEQKTQVESLEQTALLKNPNTDFHNPKKLIEDGFTDEDNAYLMGTIYGFYQNDVFDTPEWKAYEKITDGRKTAMILEELQSYKVSVEEVNIPGLNGRADKAYNEIMEFEENNLGYKEKIYSDASFIIVNNETFDEAIKEAQEWEFEVPLDESGETSFNEVTFNREWGMENPTDEEKNIARDAIRKAFVAAIEYEKINPIY